MHIPEKNNLIYKQILAKILMCCYTFGGKMPQVKKPPQTVNLHIEYR